MTCTVTMPSEVVPETRTVVWDDLYHADYQFLAPFVVELDESSFLADVVVRLIPGRRMVAFGTWNGMPAVAKIFFSRDHAERHIESDVTGVIAMDENKIPTPDLLFHGAAKDKKIQIMVFKRILKAKNLETIWQERESNEAALLILQTVMIELATQHVLGVLQKDMHMGNFLIGKKIIYTLDGAQVETYPELLSKQLSMENLALFLSQLGAGVESLQENLFLYYARARGWLLKRQDSINMQFLIKKCNESRWKSFEKKIFRNSTDFLRIKRFGVRGMIRRDYQGTEFDAFIQQPEAVFASADVVMLKNGGSSTVIKVTLDGHTLVIKRYNMKNIWHRLRRAWRVTRAEKCWRFAQKLSLFYVNTAAPVAYIESNLLGMRGKSYFVTEYVPGSDVKKFLKPYESQPYAVISVIMGVTDLLRSLVGLGVTHGDLKATNIIINESMQPVLIDLDGAAEHVSLPGLQRAWRHELKRFTSNFDDLPAIRDLLKRALWQE